VANKKDAVAHHHQGFVQLLVDCPRLFISTLVSFFPSVRQLCVSAIAPTGSKVAAKMPCEATTWQLVTADDAGLEACFILAP
jgi:hypothetical protein